MLPMFARFLQPVRAPEESFVRYRQGADAQERHRHATQAPDLEGLTGGAGQPGKLVRQGTACRRWVCLIS